MNPSSSTPPLIPLKCSSCGDGIIDAQEDQVVITDTTVIIRSKQMLKCPSCGTEFLPGEELQKHSGALNVSFIAKEVNNSTIIIGHKNSVTIGRKRED